jgi:Rne/Rng family ribonuclease
MKTAGPGEILFAAAPGERRASVLAGGAPTDLWIERPHRPSLVGGIWTGRVATALPALRAAVVDIGDGRQVWLDMARDRRLKLPAAGAAIRLQVTQDAARGKLARATARPLLPGRFLAYDPGARGYALSHRISDNRQRARLGAVLGALGKAGAGGFVARRRAPAASDTVLADEARHLREAWADIERAGGRPPPDLVSAVLAEHLEAGVERVAADDPPTLDRARRWLAEHAPEWRGRVERLAPGAFAAATDEALDRALAPEEPLPSGGALVFAETAAMTVIDVDGDRMAGGATVPFGKLNLEAARAIGRALRLRNLGGTVVVDFAGLDLAAAAGPLLRALAAAVADDPMNVEIGDISRLGVLDLSRRRGRPSLAETMLADGAQDRRAESAALAGLARVLALAATRPAASYALHAAPAAIARLAAPDLAPALAETRRRLAVALELVAEPERPVERVEAVARPAGAR